MADETVSVDIPKTAHRRLKVLAARAGTTMRQEIEEAVTRWCDEREAVLDAAPAGQPR